jgi:hypothetical protein
VSREVFISPDDPVPADGSMVNPETAVFRAHVEEEVGGRSSPGEETKVTGAEAAIAWGRERASVVWIRLGNRGDTYFSAGQEHPADDEPEEFVRHWPPEGPPTGGWWKPPPSPFA